MGVVWLAYDERLRMEVALKFLPGSVAGDPDALHDLRREITRALRLTHEGVIRVYDLHEDSSQGLAAIAMEYVNGCTLAQLKASQPERCFDVDEPFISWVKQTCGILAYVHEKKIVHRDIKPGNIMVTVDGKVKIADFGISATLADSNSRITHEPGSSGTPAYMSPQQALSQRPTRQDDIYALGATLYDLLTSTPPFFRGSASVILNALASQKPPTMECRRIELGIEGHPPIPEGWETAIAACLEKTPDDRPASAAELAEHLGINGTQQGRPFGVGDDPNYRRKELVADEIRTLGKR